MNDNNPLSISWHDSAFIPLLNPHNVLDYFSERSNPFYDRTCNNEVLKMQRVNPEQLVNMQGVEYCLLFAQEPILYVIRKQHRHSPTQVTPISNYYIIAGTVYQAPDLGSVFNSRMISSVSHLQSAFEEARGYAKYHPSRGYWWDFKGTHSTNLGPPPGAKIIPQVNDSSSEKKKKPKSKSEKHKEEASSLFQRRRVDTLLDLLTKKFQPKAIPAQAIEDQTADAKDTPELGSASASIKIEKVEPDSVDRGIKRQTGNSGSGSNPNYPDSKRLKM